MAVTRDYTVNTIELRDSFVSDSVSGSSGPSNTVGVNALLQGGVARTDTSNGKVATVNSGEKIQVAIENVKKAGGGTVILLPGTYKLDANLLIPSGVTLEGASRDGVLIDCNGSYRVGIEGGDAYSTGTVSIALGDTTVVGSGTTWTDEMVGRYIYLDGFYYEITARNSNTSITIADAYFGTDLSGYAYVLATVNFNATVRRVTIFNSNTQGLNVNYAFEPNIDDVIVYECTTGIQIYNTVYPKVYTTSSENGVNLYMYRVAGFKVDFSGFDFSTVGVGVYMEECQDATFFDTSVQGNTGSGIQLYDCSGVSFLSNSVVGNGNYGLYIEESEDNHFFGVDCENNTSDGIRFVSNSSRNSITSSSINGNGGWGIRILDTNCLSNYIIAPSFFENVSGTIDDGGTDTVIISLYGTNVATLPTAEPLNGSSTPVAVTVLNGYVVTADANQSTLDSFFGFVKQNKSTLDTNPEFLSGSCANLGTGVVTHSFTANAGTDRYAIVYLAHRSGNAIPTDMTWNGNTFTKLDQVTDSNGDIVTIWGVAIGTSGSNQTANISMTGGGSASSNNRYIAAVCYDKVNQGDPYSAIDTTTNPSGNSTTSKATAALTVDSAYGTVVAFFDTSIAAVTTSGYTTRASYTAGGGDVYALDRGFYNDQTVSFSWSTSSFYFGLGAIVLNPSAFGEVEIIHSAKITGFTGLTAGEPYYLSNTAGAISLTPGATSIVVGKALSATELLIIQS